MHMNAPANPCKRRNITDAAPPGHRFGVTAVPQIPVWMHSSVGLHNHENKRQRS